MTQQELNLPHNEPTGNIEPVVHFSDPMPTSVTVSHQGRIFVCYPKWGDQIEFTVAHDPRMLWSDTMSIGMDGYLYFTCNQLNRQARYQHGQDQRRKPYTLFRVRIDAQPVLLK